MHTQSQNRIRHQWLGWIALLAFASVLSPINIHIVIAQETPEIVVAPADPGEPPAPPQAPAADAPANTEPASATPTPVETISPPAEVPSTEPAPAAAPAQIPDVPVPDVPATPSEVSSDNEIGKLLPKDEPVAEVKAPVNESVRTLSVEPGSRTMLPEDRPAWVGAAPDFSSSQHYLYVESLPTQEPNKVDEALDAPLIAAVRNYIDQEVINQLGAADAMPLTAEFIRKNLIDNPEGFECELATGQEPAYQKWVTVRITPEQRELFRQWHTEAVQRTRLKPLGINLVAVLVLISLTHVVLRRFSGTSPLTTVNQALPVQVVNRKSRSSLNWIFFALLLGAVAFAFLMPLFALTWVSAERSSPDLHNEVRIETLEGEHGTIILESKSHR